MLHVQNARSRKDEVGFHPAYGSNGLKQPQRVDGPGCACDTDNQAFHAHEVAPASSRIFFNSPD